MEKKSLVRIIGETMGFSALYFPIYNSAITVYSNATFVEKMKELKPNILAMSALLSVTMDKVKETIDSIKNEKIYRIN